MQHANYQHLRLDDFVKDRMMFGLQSAITRKNMSVVGTKQRMINELFHPFFKVIQAFIRLIHTPFFAGVHPNANNVCFGLWRDTQLQH